jgi:hypothetical protein
MSIDEIFDDGENPGIDQRTERITIETERHRIEGILTLARTATAVASPTSSTPPSATSSRSPR